MKDATYSPEKQLPAIKAHWPGYLFLFLVNGGYQAYADQARTIRGVLMGHESEGVLTIAKGAVDSAIADLVAAGHNVAICERVKRV